MWLVSGKHPLSLSRSPVGLLVLIGALAGLGACAEPASPGPGPNPAVPDSFFAISQPAGFTVRDLGTLGGDSSVANAINQFNKVVGMSKTAAGEIRAFLWTPATQSMTDIGTLGGSFAVAYDLNAADVIVGQSTTPAGEFHAFIKRPGQAMVDLGTLGGDYSIAFGVNSASVVVGLSRVPSGELHAFKWTAAGGMIDMGTLGGDYSVGYAIDPSGQMTGYSRTPGGTLHAFRLAPTGPMVDLGTLGGPESWGQDASALGSTHYIAGYSLVRIPDPVPGPDRPSPSNLWLVYHAFRWTEQEGMRDLGAAGGLHSFGFGVNEFGDVVGQIVNILEEDRAFLWTETGGFVNLGTLGGNGSFAFAINTCGNAAGAARTAGGQLHAAVWMQQPCIN